MTPESHSIKNQRAELEARIAGLDVGIERQQKRASKSTGPAHRQDKATLDQLRFERHQKAEQLKKLTQTEKE